MSAVFDGKMTYVEAATQLDLPTDAVWKCFANHWQIETSDDGVAIALREAKGTDDYVDILNGMIKKFIKKLDVALRQEVTPMNVGAMTKLSAECRGLMRDILEFQGKLQQGPLVQLTVLQMHMTKLTNWLVSNLQPEDVEKLMKAIPELMVSNERTQAVAVNSRSEAQSTRVPSRALLHR